MLVWFLGSGQHLGAIQTPFREDSDMHRTQKKGELILSSPERLHLGARFEVANVHDASMIGL